MFRSLALALLASTSFVPAAALAQEMPTGGEVRAGQATITQTTPGAMQIVQGSNRAVIDWQSFSVGGGGRVDIRQPDAQAALLNRVTGDTTSTIAGQVNANGRVFLVNPNGILITATGSVAAAGFTASTLDIADDAFMAGSDDLTVTVTAPRLAQPIHYARGGFAGLLAGRKTGGFVVAGVRDLDGGGQALDLDGAGFLQVAMPQGGVTVAGRITAAEIVLKADTAREAARGVVNVSGMIDASSVSAKGGVITLTGDVVNLAGATLDASGAIGGGRIRAGGGYQGGEGMTRARQASVDAHSNLKADATGSGDGGSVVIWSDDKTSFAGHVSAHGANGGSGGDAEVSGKALLNFTGTADLTGRRFGTLLLDPYNVTISIGAQTTGSGFAANADDSVINATTLQNALATANVTVSTNNGGSQAGNIYVDAPIAWSSGSLLTLSATGQLYLNRNIDVNGGGQLALNFATSDANTGGLVYGVGAKVTFADNRAGQALSLNGTSYTLLRSMAELDAIDGQSGIDGSAITANGSTAGQYALAKDLNAGGTTYQRPLLRNWGGAFEGLGHSISNLTISTPNGLGLTYAALFAGTTGGTSPVIRGFSLLNASVTGVVGTTAIFMGILSGGLVSQVSTTGSASGALSTAGLVSSMSGGRIALSFSTASVSNGARLATFSTAYLGGLVAQFTGGSIVRSYATGSVTAGGTASLPDQFAAGGLIGAMNTSANIVQSYATGSVTAASGSNANVGGLIGRFVGAGTGGVSETYATGAVSGSAARGGLIGRNETTGSPTIASSYWDTQSTGQTAAAGSGNQIGTGRTTAQLQGGTLPAGFDPAVWTAVQGFYPALTPAARSGVAQPMQVITGTGFLSSGTAATGASIGLYYNGSLLTGNSVVTDANGAYRALVPANTLTGPFAIGQTIALSGAGTVSGLAYNDNLTPGSDGNVSGLSVTSGIRAITSDLRTNSELNTALVTTFGSFYPGIDSVLRSTPTRLNSTAPNFTLDTATTIASGTTLTIASPGNIDINAAVTGTGGTLVLAPGGGVANTGVVTATGAINIGTFNLLNGTWNQVKAVLPGFSATDFRFTPGAANFLRANGGTGSATTPYRIVDAYGLQGMGSGLLLARSFVLANAIDAAGTANWNAGAGFVPIGSDGTGALWNGSAFAAVGYADVGRAGLASGFSGSLNGNGFAVTGLNINRPGVQNVGMFGGSSGTIGNLTLAGNVTGYVSVGGLVGLQQGGSITGVTSLVNVTGSSGSAYVGGLAGFASGTTISSSDARGAVSATGGAGGLVGLLYNSTLTSSRSSSAVTGRAGRSGGLVGIVEGAKVTGGTSTGTVNGGPAGATPYGVLRDGGTYEDMSPA